MPRKRSPSTDAFGYALRSLRVERGEFNVSLETILKLAGALEVSAAEVLRRAGL